VRGTQDEEKKKQAIYRNQIKAKLEPSARHGRFSASNAWISARKSIHSLHQCRHSVFVKCDAGKQRQAAAAIKVLLHAGRTILAQYLRKVIKIPDGRFPDLTRCAFWTCRGGYFGDALVTDRAGTACFRRDENC
jgi:hypothetical protein